MTFGLNEEAVKKSRSKYGSNEIIKKSNNSFIRLLIESLGDPIIKILLIALAIKIIFLFKNFDWYETLGILIAIFLASFISSISEYGSNKAFERLQEENKKLKVKVYRNGILTEIYVSDIVVGDIIKITSGDKIPADGHIISGNLCLDESFLTGESKEIYKKINDKVYGGSTIYKGDANILIDYVGIKTRIGQISDAMQTKNEESPLKTKLRVLAKGISKLGYIGSILASISYLFLEIVIKNHFDINLIISTITNFKLMINYLIYSLTLSVTIIIMAVPEGLPMMITLVLSSNMKKMLKDNILVRKLVGIETSGSLNVLLCDKTGTLTEGKLKVNKFITYDNIPYSNLNRLKKYSYIVDSLILNNEAIISKNNIIGGNLTDEAILKFCYGINSNNKVLLRKEFSSETKYSYVKCDNGITYYKGASEVLLSKCKGYLDKNGEIKYSFDYKYIEKIIDNYTNNGYRVLIDCFSKTDINNLIFLGIIVISDVVRKEAKKSIELIQKAGIKVIMITGDAKKTAISIGNNLGIINNNDIILTHDDLIKMDDNKLMEISDNICIVARALPEDKSRLVSIYKRKNLVVGMTGDGVNDAIALKKSDVSFALGSGTEVAKEASNIVIMDNNILSICKAILYGRTIFKSIRKFVTYQLTVNICALILSILGTFFGISTPITIIQMLWINMIMDTFAGLAFSYEAPLKEYMDEKPKNKDEKIMNKYMINQITVNGIYSSILCLLFLKLPLINHFIRYSNDNKYLLTSFFALFIFLGILNAFLSRTHRLNIFANILKNKIFIFINLFIFIVQIFIIYKGGNIFRTYGLSFNELLFTLLISLSILPIDFIRKRYLKYKKVNIGM